MAKQGDVRGNLFAECSSILPELVDKIAKLMIDHGAEFVSCPGMYIIPSSTWQCFFIEHILLHSLWPVTVANSGTLTFATAGAKSSIEKMRPYFKSIMGRDEIYFEDEPNSNAAKFKLMGNAFVLNAITQLA